MKYEIQSVIKTIDEKGRIAIPKELREIASLKTGDVIKIKTTKKSITLRKVRSVNYEENSLKDTERMIDNALFSSLEDCRLNIVKKVIDSIERETIKYIQNKKAVKMLLLFVFIDFLLFISTTITYAAGAVAGVIEETWPN